MPACTLSLFAIVRICGLALATPPGEVLTAGDGLRAVELADLDLDGIPDLITTDTGALTVWPGYFGEDPGEPFQIAVGSAPTAVLVRDANGDGVPDLLVADSLANTVGVYLADGHGYTRTEDHLFVRRGPRYMELADFDGDGIDDLVVANSGSTSEVFVFKGLGSGRYEYSDSFRTPHRHVGMAVKDFDGDGLPDLALAMSGSYSESHSRVRVYHGRGDGSFAPPAVWLVPRRVTGMVCADFDGDGRWDLATSSASTEKIAGVLMNRGGGLFEEAVPVETGYPSSTIASEDMDGDGLPDLIFGYATGSLPYAEKVEYFRNTGDGAFERAGTVFAGRVTERLAAGPVDASGNVGVVMRTGGPTRISLARMTAAARFIGRRHVGVEGRPLSAVSADLNGDGVSDLVVTGNGVRPLQILMSDRSGSLVPIDPPQITGSVGEIRIADVNRDGLDDLVLGNVSWQSPSVLINRGNGSFEPVVSSYSRKTVRVADVNGDGVPDFVSTRHNTEAVFVHFGEDDGGEGPPVRHELPAVPVGLELGDFSGNGVIDVLALLPQDTPGSTTIVVLRGDGAGGFNAGSPLVIPGVQGSIRVADLDSDQRDDLVVTDPIRGAVSVLFSDENGGFSGALTLIEDSDVGDAYPADVTGDGVIDVFVSVAGNDEILLYEGRGDGSFLSPRSFLAGVGPLGLTVGDFNADGIPDMAVVNAGAGNPRHNQGVTILANPLCPADLRAPFGVLDQADSAAFVAAFLNGQPEADLAPPYGSTDFWDLRLFVRLFTGGCE